MKSVDKCMLMTGIFLCLDDAECREQIGREAERRVIIEIVDSRGFISAALTSLITFKTLLAKSPRDPYRPPCRACLSFWVLSQQKRMESRRTVHRYLRFCHEFRYLVRFIGFSSCIDS